MQYYMRLIFDSRQVVTYVFVAVAIAIVASSLLFSHKLVNELAVEERNKIEIWAEATRAFAHETENSDMNLILHILQSNSTIPVILYDSSSDTYVANNLNVGSINEYEVLSNKASDFSKRHEPIVIEELNQFLYYDDSYTLKQLALFPYVQLSVLFLFIALAFFALRSSLKSEQNKVWMGLSKETAHQLGTPISSLMAWIELIKLKGGDVDLLDEVDKDLDRLEMIADRFSKIGSSTDLKVSDLRIVTDRALQYMKRRISDKIVISTSFPEDEVMVELNEPLFEWVIENLIKNATDAMGGEGSIDLQMRVKDNKAIMDVSDSGRGIAKSKFKKVFLPGYTTKARGWGLGLSLVKRIVEKNHNGKIFVKSSELGVGSTFRIVLCSAKT